MGEVYRATDTNLKRQVAIKVLPASVAGDAERLARFQREAEVLAALNHPNIAQIHGLERSDGTIALVMELVEGPTLADRIAQGAISVDEALPIAKQIAEALEAAHEQGIIHRDLKPANVKVRPDGTVKVLDFGLAKAMEPAAAMSPIVSQSPTITSPAMMTGVGMILGTAAYMSPEQARGKPVDKRADIWAFGCLLYEMLAGKRALEGDEVSDTLAAVLRQDIDWNALPASTTAVRRLLVRCLERDVRRRLRDIGEARIVLEDPSALAMSEGGNASLVISRMPLWRRAMPAAAATVTGALLAGLGFSLLSQPAPATVVRTTISTTEGTALALEGTDRDVTITPDGSRVVYRGADNQILVRALDQLEPIVLSVGPGPGPRGLFISPDGQWVGFYNGNAWKKVSIAGGPLVDVAAGQGVPRGATWGPTGTIIFATLSSDIGLQRVSAGGGDVTVLTRPKPEQGELDHLWPEFLPGGNAVLFTITPLSGNIEDAQIAVLDLQTRYVEGPPPRRQPCALRTHRTPGVRGFRNVARRGVRPSTAGGRRDACAGVGRRGDDRDGRRRRCGGG